MSEGLQGILILVGIAVVIAIIAHGVSRRFLLSSAVTAIMSSAAFNALASVKIGYVDPFFPIALVVGTAYALPVAVLVGLASRRARR